MESSPPALSSSTAGAEPAKPMSKLALLAQKRREEAQARMTAGSSASQTASATPVSTADTQDSPSKPLSKLALKMAAARAAKAEQSARSSPDAPSATTPATAESMDIDDQHDAQVSSSLFSFAPGPSCRPSPFFNLLTTHKHQTPLMAPSSSTKLHLPFVKDEERLEQRVREAFGPGVESPDDIVLKARGGRAGTTAETVPENGPARPVPVKVPASTTKGDDVAQTPGVEQGNEKKQARTKAPSKKSQTITASGAPLGKKPLKPSRKPSASSSNPATGSSAPGRAATASDSATTPSKASSASIPVKQSGKKPNTGQPVPDKAAKTKPTGAGETKSRLKISKPMPAAGETGREANGPSKPAGGDPRPPSKARPKSKVIMGPP